MGNVEEMLVDLVLAADKVLSSPSCGDPDCCKPAALHADAIGELRAQVDKVKGEIGLP